MKTCFSIMPFDSRFTDIDRIVAAAAAECGLEYVRGDRLHQAGSILPQVLRHIRDAAVVVADISDPPNPNVFYELGIAHHVKGPERVVILNQDPGKSPYDVHEFRQLRYSAHREGRARLRRELPARLLEAASSSADEETWKVVRGRLPRTRLIVRDLRNLIEGSPADLRGVTIRIVASMGSLAISDHEPPDTWVEPDYFEALLDERNTLREALLSGVRLKAVLNPPRRFARTMLPARLRVRYERLIGLLEGRSDVRDRQAAEADINAIRSCEFSLSPVPMVNLFIIGERVAYEGMKRGGSGGFEMTHCETNPAGVRDLIGKFDELFDDSRREMARLHPPDGRIVEQLRAFYDEATGLL